MTNKQNTKTQKYKKRKRKNKKQLAPNMALKIFKYKYIIHGRKFFDLGLAGCFWGKEKNIPHTVNACKADTTRWHKATFTSGRITDKNIKIKYRQCECVTVKTV